MLSMCLCLCVCAWVYSCVCAIVCVCVCRTCASNACVVLFYSCVFWRSTKHCIVITKLDIPGNMLLQGLGLRPCDGTIGHEIPGTCAQAAQYVGLARTIYIYMVVLYIRGDKWMTKIRITLIHLKSTLRAFPQHLFIVPKLIVNRDTYYCSCTPDV